jgi:hypothetical protein
VVKLRGKSVNRCDYCAREAAMENAEMLLLDALDGDAPQLWLCLGTRTATTDLDPFYNALRLVKRALRRRWPAAEYAALLEFTTGYGPRSGGLRRPHWNVLLKGIPAAALDQVGDVVRRVWCRHVDAEPAAQHVGEVTGADGLMRYIALHFQKESQAPPAGFSGQRFNCSRGYFGDRTRAQARSRARESIARRRAVWRAGQAGIEDAYDRELAAHQALKLNAATRWVLTTASGARIGREPVGPELAQRLRAALAAGGP